MSRRSSNLFGSFEGYGESPVVSESKRQSPPSSLEEVRELPPNIDFVGPHPNLPLLRRLDTNILFVLDFDGVVSKSAGGLVGLAKDLYEFGPVRGNLESAARANIDELPEGYEIPKAHGGSTPTDQPTLKMGSGGTNLNLVRMEEATRIVTMFLKKNVAPNETLLQQQRWVLSTLLPKLAWSDGKVTIYSGNGATIVKKFFDMVTDNNMWFETLVGTIDMNDIGRNPLPESKASKSRLNIDTISEEGQQKARKRSLFASAISAPIQRTGRTAPSFSATSVGRSVFNIGKSKFDIFVRLLKDVIGTYLVVYIDDAKMQVDAFINAVKDVSSGKVTQQGPFNYAGGVSLHQLVLDGVVVAHVWYTPYPNWLAVTYKAIISNAEAIVSQKVSRMPESEPPIDESAATEEPTIPSMYPHPEEHDSSMAGSSTSTSSSTTSSSSSSFDTSSITPYGKMSSLSLSPGTMSIGSGSEEESDNDLSALFGDNNEDESGIQPVWY